MLTRRLFATPKTTAANCYTAVVRTLASSSSSSFSSSSVTLDDPLDPCRLMIMGPPGGGKGTIAKMVTKDFGISQLSSGDLIRSQIQQETEIGKQVAELVHAGGLVPDEVITQIVVAELAGMEDTHWMLDGFPRTTQQAEDLANVHTLDAVINVDVPFDVIVERLKDRWTHPGSGRIYNLQFNPPKVAGVDDETGEPLIQREDDKPETVLARLKQYELSTKPLCDFYREKGLLAEFKGTETKKIYPHIADFLAGISKLNKN